ncbi:MAG: polyphosphate:AMP phosphotransferase [Pseudomonadaceae bacterium]|nr:polyphosphate:AMP phosphotransferase [Pseudomonadaceae bacterium]
MNESSGLFAAAEIGNTISKDVFDAQIEALRVDLLNAQFDLRHENFSVVLLIAGDDRPGAVNLFRTLHDWMDARYMQNHITFGAEHNEDAERPVLGRYWRRLPADGQIGVYLGGWPTSFLRVGLQEEWTKAQFERAAEHISRFEQQLVDDGTLVLKYWLHLPDDILQKRLKAAEQDPEKHWDFAQHDWELLQQSDELFQQIEALVRRTHTLAAPWSIIESTDQYYATLTVGRHIADALAARLEQPDLAPSLTPPVSNLSPQSLLGQIDLTLSADQDTYSSDLQSLQSNLNQLAHKAQQAGVSCVFVFEGVDAAGKGGAIRRLVRALPVEYVRVIAIGAPNEAEKAHHYLWRFWTRIPKPGHDVVFDRSWYGRVLVERVEGFATEFEWSRAYEEINEFEESLFDAGMVVCKFWLQIDADEQLQRFEARALTPYKKYKLTEEDYRNREKWDEYQLAADDMVARTNTPYAPWHLIAANDKRHARLQVLRTVTAALQQRLDDVDAAADEGGDKKNGRKQKKSKS